MKASVERVQEMIAYSESVYAALDQTVGSEARARAIVRFGVHLTAQMLETSHKNSMVTGDYLHAWLWRELQKGGVHLKDTKPWPAYGMYLATLPRPRLIGVSDTVLDDFAQSYADVERATLAHDYTPESNARHVAHLAAVAIPYAVQYYPHLDPAAVMLNVFMHDALEAYVGDTPTLGASHEQMRQKNIDEHHALELFQDDFGTIYPRLVQLVTSYENLESDEARFAKTFDKIDPKFTHFATRGSAIHNRYHMSQERFEVCMSEQNGSIRATYGRDYPLVMDDHEELSRLVARVTWP